MLKDITFGQYFEAPSLIHRIDPRIKIILLIAQLVFIFVADNFYSLAVALLFTVISILLSKVPIKMYLKNLKAILPIIIFTAVINLFYGGGNTVLLKVWKIAITEEAILKSLFFSLRIILLIISSSVLTYTTTPNDLTDAIQRLLSPLKIFGLKNAVHTLAMMMTIALRFIPTLVEETEKIMNAQKARGVDFENGKLKEKINALIPILIPLLISAVRRAYELAEAMECRCYNGADGRTRMKVLSLKAVDFAAVTVSLLFFFGIILCNYL